MSDERTGVDVADMLRAIASLLGLDEAYVKGVIIIAALGGDDYVLTHTAANTAAACDVAMQVFSAKPHVHDYPQVVVL